MRKRMPGQRALRVLHSTRLTHLFAVPSDCRIRRTANLARRETDLFGQETKIMKTTFIAAALLALTMGMAHAESEGNGEPFPNHASTGNVVANQVLSDTGSEAAPRFGRGVTLLTQGDVLPTDGTESAVQTANSLPRGFEAGTVAYAQAESVQRWAAAHQRASASRLASRGVSLAN